MCHITCHMTCLPTWSIQCTIIGRRKAAVFPEPVFAIPMMSRPPSPAGIACSHISIHNKEVFVSMKLYKGSLFRSTVQLLVVKCSKF